MATFFGEVILPSSRAFFDELDEDENDETEVSYRIKQQLSLKKYLEVSSSEYKQFIVSDGTIAKGFTHLYMQKDNDKLVAEIEVLRDEDKDSSDILILKPKKIESTKLFLLSNKCLLLQISANIDLGMSNQLTTLLGPWLNNCERVISIVSRHISSYRCDSVNELPPAFVRGLGTSYHQLPQGLKHLEQPNFISNVPASVMTWCEAHNIPALMLVLYSDQEALDTLTVTPLLKTFTETGLSEFILNHPGSRILNSTLKNMDKTFMYM